MNVWQKLRKAFIIQSKKEQVYHYDRLAFFYFSFIFSNLSHNFLLITISIMLKANNINSITINSYLIKIRVNIALKINVPHFRYTSISIIIFCCSSLFDILNATSSIYTWKESLVASIKKNPNDMIITLYINEIFKKCPIINKKNAILKHIVNIILILSFIFKYNFPKIVFPTNLAILEINTIVVIM